MSEPRTELIDNVNHPKHYTDCSLECIDVMVLAFGEDATFDFCVCNAFKYLWRYQNKNGVEDIKKAKWYLNKAEDLLKGGTSIVLETLKQLWVSIVEKEGIYNEV